MLVGVAPISYGAEGDIEINASNFPDENFRTAVEGFDVDDDGTLTLAELNAVTSIDVEYKSISNLKGIEHFTNLEFLNCNRNQLASLNVSNNTKLEDLVCYDNQLTSLDISQNPNLEFLDCDYNQLTSLDVSNNINLKVLLFDGNQLTSIDVSKNTQLEYLRCGGNQLTSLDLSQNTNLEGLECSENQLTSLDLSRNTKLEFLDCYENKLASLDLTQNTKLIKLYNKPQFANVTAVAILEGGKYKVDLEATFPDRDISAVEEIHVFENISVPYPFDSEYDSSTHIISFDESVGTSGFIAYLDDVNYDKIDPEEDPMLVILDWKAGYTLTFNSKGGSEVKAQNIISGGKATEPTPPTKEGHTFIAWFKDEALVEEFDIETPILENTTLYAKWQVNEKPPVEDDSGKEDPTDGSVDDTLREVEDLTKPADNKLGEKTLPKTGTVGPTLFYILGGLSICIGMAMRRKRNYEK